MPDIKEGGGRKTFCPKWLWKQVETKRPKIKETIQKHCTLGGEFVSHRFIS